MKLATRASEDARVAWLPLVLGVALIGGLCAAYTGAEDRCEHQLLERSPPGEPEGAERAAPPTDRTQALR
jgi:hypothetical protein